MDDADSPLIRESIDDATSLLFEGQHSMEEQSTLSSTCAAVSAGKSAELDHNQSDHQKLMKSKQYYWANRYH